MRFRISVEVFLREGVSDPEGQTIADAASHLGFPGVRSVAAGKAFALVIEAANLHEATEVAERISSELLSNPVIQRHRIGEITAEA